MTSTDYGSFEWPPSGGSSGSGVSSLNTLTGDIVIEAGAGITVTGSGQDIIIAATGEGALTFSDSLVDTAGTVTLVGDTATPGDSQYYGTNSGGTLGYYDLPSPGTGTVTSVSVISANGFAGTVATATTTPAITISTSITGILQGNGTAISAASTTGTGNVVLASNPTISGLSAGSTQIINVEDPTTAQMAATKNYVDTQLAALNPQDAVYAATVGSNISGTYISVAAGIGDTFTTTATGTFTLDGTTPPLGARILIKDQSSGYQNGIYTITTLGTTGISTIFTRAIDYDTPADMNTAGLIPVINGTLNALSSWQQVATIVSIGPAGTALVFSEFTANPSLYLLKANNLSDVASASTSFKNISPLTTLGDLIYEGSGPTPARLGIGSTNNALIVSGGIPAWGTIALGSSSAVSGQLIVANGGTGASTLTANAILLGNGTSALQEVAAGTVGNAVVDTGSTWISSAGALGIQNLGLATSVASSALTIALTQYDGATNASSTSPVFIPFRNSTATTGGYSSVAVTGALSIVVPSSATLGQTSALNQYVWIYALNHAGTVELAVSGVNVFPDNSIQTTTAIGTGSTSGYVLYSTTARTSVAIRLIGRALVNETTAGTWASNATDLITNPNPIPNITDFVFYSPTCVGLGTISSASFFYRRVGDSIEVTGSLETGSVSGSTVEIGLPGSLTTAASTRVPTGASVGGVWSRAASAAQYYQVNVPQSTGYITLGVQATGSSGQSNITGTSVNSSEQLGFHFWAPISGWSTYGP